MARRRRRREREREHEHQHKKAHKNVLPTIEPKPGAGGTTTNTTSSPGAGDTASGGVTAAAGDLTGATTTAPVPQQESMDEIQAFFSTGTGAAQHYHQVPQQAESAEVQQTGASQ